MSVVFVPGCGEYPISEFQRIEQEEIALKDAQAKINQILNHLGFCQLDKKNGSEMIRCLQIIQSNRIKFSSPYDSFAQDFLLPKEEEAIQIAEVRASGPIYYSAQTKEGEEVAVAKEKEDLSESLVENVKMMIRFVLSQ